MNVSARLRAGSMQSCVLTNYRAVFLVLRRLNERKALCLFLASTHPHEEGDVEDVWFRSTTEINSREICSPNDEGTEH